MLLQSEQEKEALKADAAQAKQQLCRYSFVVLLLCAFCLFPNASTCTCCLGNVILKAVKQTKYQSSFTVLNFYPWAIKGWWGISLSTSIHRCTTKCQPLVILENKQCVEMMQITSSVRTTVKGMSRWGCVAAIGTLVLLMNSQEYKVILFIVQIETHPAKKQDVLQQPSQSPAAPELKIWFNLPGWQRSLKSSYPLRRQNTLECWTTCGPPMHSNTRTLRLQNWLISWALKR